MSEGGGRPFPVRPLVVAALLMLILSGLSLERADKLASIGGLFIALAAFFYAYRSGGDDRTAEQVVDPAQPMKVERTGLDAAIHRWVKLLGRLMMGGRRVPLGAAVIAAAAVALIGMTIAYAMGGPDEPPLGKATAVLPSPSAPAATMPSPAPSVSPAVGDCPLPGPTVATSASTSPVLRHARMTLPEWYYADLDSTCPNWGIASTSDSSIHDIVNDGTGIFHDLDTEIARVPAKAPGTYAMCLSNTDYVNTTVEYDSLKSGDRYCVKTADRGSSRQSLLTITAVQRNGSTRTVVLDVLTWALTEPREQDDDSVPIAIAIVVIAVLVLGGGATASGKGEGQGKSGDRRRA